MGLEDTGMPKRTERMAKRTERDSRERFMWAALGLALGGMGSTHPNPVVGAVVVQGGKIVGRGFHRRWGLPHAEAEAIKDAGEASGGADLYVTLEPCYHYGRTPPCTEAITRGGIRRVFASMLDPNPLVNGRGARALKRAGVDVRIGLLADAAERLNEAYVKFMRTGRPFVTMKVAQTLDGRIATASGDARWITSPLSRETARAMRSEAQAVIVGSRTVLADDPLLLSMPRRRANYYRCVLDTHLALPATGRIARTARQYPVIAYCTGAGGPRMRELATRRSLLESKGVLVVPVGTGPDGLLDIEQVACDLASRKVMHVWVEGGGTVFTSFLKKRMVDKVIAFIAPKIMGDGGSVASVGKLGVRSAGRCAAFEVEGLDCVGSDVVVTMYPRQGRAGAAGRGCAAAGSAEGLASLGRGACGIRRRRHV